MRKQETRTKIQLGGLILKSGLADLLKIKQGDDLQLDALHRDKAHMLLGILLDAVEKFNSDSMTYYLSKGKNDV